MTEPKQITSQEIVDIFRSWEDVFGLGFRLVAIAGDDDDECDIEARGPKAKYTVAQNVPDEVAALFLRASDILYELVRSREWANKVLAVLDADGGGDSPGGRACIAAAHALGRWPGGEG